KCQSKTMLLGTETLLKSDVKLSLLMAQLKALTAEHKQWQKTSPELISTNPDVLLSLGKEEVWKVKNDLEMLLSTVQSKNKRLEEDLKREQQWLEEQSQILDALNRIEEETKTQVEQLSKTRTAYELRTKLLELKIYKEELLHALGDFLGEHFPLPLEDGNDKEKRLKSSCFVNFLNLILLVFQILLNKLLSTPHEPYVTINDSFWPPYIELLLRNGIALRHPEDPNRLRLEAFH
ncbi:Centromere protein K, partial [Leptosomus discolor]